MWFFMAAISVALVQVPLETQEGSCECQTRLWQRSFWPFLAAREAMASPPEYEKVFCEGSMASHCYSIRMFGSV